MNYVVSQVSRIALSKMEASPKKDDGASINFKEIAAIFLYGVQITGTT